MPKITVNLEACVNCAIPTPDYGTFCVHCGHPRALRASETPGTLLPIISLGQTKTMIIKRKLTLDLEQPSGQLTENDLVGLTLDYAKGAIHRVAGKHSTEKARMLIRHLGLDGLPPSSPDMVARIFGRNVLSIEQDLHQAETTYGLAVLEDLHLATEQTDVD
jgi:hypothetical protein